MPLPERKKVNYVIVCVNEFARRKGLPIQDAFRYLYHHKGITFLDECYNAEHTLSLDDAIGDLTIVCSNNGGTLCEAVHKRVFTMSKQEQLMEYIVQDVVAFIMEDTGMKLEKAMHRFYTSDLFEKLHDPETGLYLEGSAFIYELYKAENSLLAQS